MEDRTVKECSTEYNEYNVYHPEYGFGHIIDTSWKHPTLCCTFYSPKKEMFTIFDWWNLMLIRPFGKWTELYAEIMWGDK